MFEKNLYNPVAQIRDRPEISRVDAIPKKSLVDVVVAELRQRLADGKLKGILPGVRLLARSLGVSVPTLCRALHGLENEGLLEGGGNKRRWRVRDDSSVAAAGFPQKKHPAGGAIRTGRPGRLLFLSSMSLRDERQSGVEVFAELLDQFGSKGWEVMHRVENFQSAKKPRRSWDELLRLTRPDAMVALGGTPVLGRWARAKGIRTLFLGGDPGDSGVPVVAVRTSTMLRHTLDHLLALRHRRILLPLCGRGPGFVVKCRETAAEITTAAGLPSASVLIAETVYEGPEVVADLLRKQWRKRVPDALILLDWREFVAASCFFREEGIGIPQDLSVVILSQNSSMEWHSPRITRFEHPVKLLARTTSKWVTEGRKTSGRGGIIEVRARWVEGKSVAARK